MLCISGTTGQEINSGFPFFSSFFCSDRFEIQQFHFCLPWSGSFSVLQYLCGNALSAYPKSLRIWFRACRGENKKCRRVPNTHLREKIFSREHLWLLAQSTNFTIAKNCVSIGFKMSLLFWRVSVLFWERCLSPYLDSGSVLLRSMKGDL